MKHLLNALLVAAAVFPICLSGQTLPDTYSNTQNRTLVQRSQTHASYGLYTADTVRTIALTFADTNWWQQIDDSIGFAELVYGDLKLDSVAVKIKGSSSDFANNTLKKSFDISFDEIHEDQNIDGYDRTNLHCGIFDASHVRENVFNWIGGNYLPIAKSNFVHLTINGQNWGAYTNTQQLDKDFLKEWFVDPDGPRWRGESPFGRIGADTSCVDIVSTDGRQATPSALHYLGADSAAYWRYYVPKGNHKQGDWDKLVTFIGKLNTIPDSLLVDSLDQYLDVDGALWFLAHEILLGDEDSYVFKTQSDYYLYYEPSTGRMTPLEYDGNSCLEARSTQWSPLHRADDPCLPLLHRLVSVPEWRQRYLAHCRTITERYLNPEVVLPQIAYYAELIDSFEQNDPIGDSLFLYDKFQSGIDELNRYIVNRHDFLSTHPLLDVATCTLGEAEVSLSAGRPFLPTSQDSVFASVELSAAAVGRAFVYYAAGVGQVFDRAEMFDDGLHGDGFPNDGRYGGVIPPFEAQTQVVYYFEALTSDTLQSATYYPSGATHSVFSYGVEPDRAINHPVRINELMASNASIVADEEGEFEDWVELYNSSALPINLQGYALSDKEAFLDKWIIDESLIIPARGFLTLWCDDDEDDGPAHTNFKLSKSGEHLFLSNPVGEVIDEVKFEEQTTDISLARSSDGIGAFIQQAPTFGATNVLDGVPGIGSGGGLDTVAVITPNTSTAGQISEASLAVTIFPNPISATASSVYLKGDAQAALRISVYDALGHLLLTVPVNLDVTGVGHFPLSIETSGVYTVQIRTQEENRSSAIRLVVH